MLAPNVGPFAHNVGLKHNPFAHNVRPHRGDIYGSEGLRLWAATPTDDWIVLTKMQASRNAPIPPTAESSHEEGRRPLAVNLTGV